MLELLYKQGLMQLISTIAFSMVNSHSIFSADLIEHGYLHYLAIPLSNAKCRTYFHTVDVIPDARIGYNVTRGITHAYRKPALTVTQSTEHHVHPPQIAYTHSRPFLTESVASGKHYLTKGTSLQVISCAIVLSQSSLTVGLLFLKGIIYNPLDTTTSMIHLPVNQKNYVKFFQKFLCSKILMNSHSII